MDDALDKVRRAALDSAAASATLGDTEKTAAIAKALAEAEKSASQVIISLSATLVPVVSL